MGLARDRCRLTRTVNQGDPVHVTLVDNPPTTKDHDFSFEHSMKSRRTQFSLRLAAITRLCTALVLCFSVANSGAQNSHRTIDVKVLDGRNGKPIKGAHLLIFAGGTAEELRRHSQHFDLLTDQHGEAELTLDSDSIKFLQVWVDKMTLCQPRPNAVSLSVEEALAKGLLAPNGCGKLHMSSTPGQLSVFARPATFGEKMEW
jgi:hypothetical protein